jgi:hypothetical protein
VDWYWQRTIADLKFLCFTLFIQLDLKQEIISNLDLNADIVVNIRNGVNNL